MRPKYDPNKETRFTVLSEAWAWDVGIRKAGQNSRLLPPELRQLHQETEWSRHCCYKPPHTGAMMCDPKGFLAWLQSPKNFNVKDVWGYVSPLAIAIDLPVRRGGIPQWDLHKIFKSLVAWSVMMNVSDKVRHEVSNAIQDSQGGFPTLLFQAPKSLRKKLSSFLTYLEISDDPVINLIRFARQGVLCTELIWPAYVTKDEILKVRKAMIRRYFGLSPEQWVMLEPGTVTFDDALVSAMHKGALTPAQVNNPRLTVQNPLARELRDMNIDGTGKPLREAFTHYTVG